MAYTFVSRNGQRLEVNVAAAFDRMNSDFTRDTGCELIVTSGTRTNAEQEAIFRARYVLANAVSGRRVYDIRRWNGAVWYRISAAGTVATPGASNHQEGGPNGPRSVDLRDTGRDAGVTRRGTVRDNWMAANAGKYNFQNEGYGFSEPWHKTFRGVIGAAAPAAVIASAAVSSSKFSQDVKNRQAFLISRGFNLGPSGADGLAGPMYRAAVKAYQIQLKGLGLYRGLPDAVWGSGTEQGHRAHWARINVPAAPPKVAFPNVTVAGLGKIGNVQGLQKVARLGGYAGLIDNSWGPRSRDGLQTWLNRSYGGSLTAWLRKKWGYSGNEQFGPNMLAALQRANAANNRAL
jgi:hypothetical protein